MNTSSCPTCGQQLETVTEQEKQAVYGKKYDDEDVFWCPKCKEYILEEDFLYNSEE